MTPKIRIQAALNVQAQAVFFYSRLCMMSLRVDITDGYILTINHSLSSCEIKHIVPVLPSIHPFFSAYPIQDRGVTRDYSSYNGGQITNLSREFICLFNLKNSASLPLTCQCHCSPALLQALLTPPPSLILPVGSGGEVYSLLT